MYGTVIASHGRHYLVQTETVRLNCVTRGKKNNVAVGDIVKLELVSTCQGVIESIEKRETLLYRSDQYKSKILAANVTQLFIVVATEPGFSDDLVSRALIAAEAADIAVRLVLNKTDVLDQLPKTRQCLHLYASLEYSVHEVSALKHPTETVTTLAPLLKGHSTILIGQSGMGKSSLINLLVPDAYITTREISVALDTGKHTTTFTRLYGCGSDTIIIDSPGFQEFGLYHLSEGMLERAFREFLPHLGKCRFYNCHHLTEPGCAILAATQEGHISTIRHMLYKQLVHEASQKLY